MEVFERLAPFEFRDTVRCPSCEKPAERLVSRFTALNTTRVGANAYSGIEMGTGIKGIETHKDAQRALELTGTQPVEAYYRAPKPPPPKEVTMEELAPYLDGMPLNNEPV